jgi:hypothetical protein
MDHTGEPSTKIDLQPVESRSNDTPDASESICTGSDHTAIRQPQSDPIPSIVGSQVHFLMEERTEAVGASTTPSPCHCHCACVLTNQADRANPDSHDVVRGDENDPFGKHGMETDRMYSEMGDISDVSSHGHEPLEKLDSVPDLVLSEDGDDHILGIDEQAKVSAVS